MAKLLGQPATYVTDQTVKKLKKQLVIMFLTSYSFAFALGLIIGLTNWLCALIAIAVATASVPIIDRFLTKTCITLERRKIHFRNGAKGEVQVASILDQFPDDYTVVHDMAIPYGNVDHLVVGPSGVYVVDTKNWRGVITADGKGELLLNGRPIKKPAAKNLSRTVMAIKDKIKTLSGLDPYIHGILAFPSAAVEARWGTTGRVHCLKDDQLYDYIVESKKPDKLAKKEVQAISKAITALVAMDSQVAASRPITEHRAVSKEGRL